MRRYKKNYSDKPAYVAFQQMDRTRIYKVSKKKIEPLESDTKCLLFGNFYRSVLLFSSETKYDEFSGDSLGDTLVKTLQSVSFSLEGNDVADAIDHELGRKPYADPEFSDEAKDLAAHGA